MSTDRIKRYAKAVVAVAGFVVVVANAVATGDYDTDTLISAAVALAVALGVYSVPNQEA